MTSLSLHVVVVVVVVVVGSAELACNSVICVIGMDSGSTLVRVTCFIGEGHFVPHVDCTRMV